MSRPSSDFLSLLPQHRVARETGPIYYLWVFDPQSDTIRIEHNEGRHPADRITHEDLARDVPHPERVHGYAYRIGGGWRITTWEHRAVEDPHVKTLVRDALNGERHRHKDKPSQVALRAV